MIFKISSYTHQESWGNNGGDPNQSLKWGESMYTYVKSGCWQEDLIESDLWHDDTNNKFYK